MPLNITVSFTLPYTHTGNESQLGSLDTKGGDERDLEVGWAELGGLGGCGVTGYVDALLHFALECTISGIGAKVRPGFRQCWSGLERWITYLKKSKSMAKDLIWNEAQQYREKSVKPGERETLIEEIHYHWRSQQA